MINSQSMTLGQKQKFWKQHKEDRFKQMAGDKCALFNYFLSNNDILHKIDDRDFLAYNLILLDNMDRQANIFFGSLVGVFLTDRFIINRVFPNFKFKEWRLTANLLKFVAWPFCIFKIAEHFILKESREQMFKIQERYQFGFKDYLQANKLFERALAVNRLQELLQKRDKFDWNQVPEIKDSQ